ncbi:MAG: sialidase family protein [Pseudomonadota bacterium]
MKPLTVLLLLCLMIACTPSTPNIPLNGVVARNASTPHLARDEDGTIVLSYLSAKETGTALRYVRLEEGGWSNAVTVAEGANWFVNWADFPSVVPLTGNQWAAHWLVEKTGDAFAYDAFAAISTDAGKHWSKPIALHDDGTYTEHGFVSLFSTEEGQVGAVWLDGRAFAAAANDSPGTQLRTATVSELGHVSNPAVIDPLVCDCCQTDLAMTSSGPVVAYRNRNKQEVRDIYTSRWLEGQWQAGRELARDGWVINGCPVNGPAIDARGDEVTVAWFTDHPTARVQVAFSTNGAETFSDPINVNADNTLGRVDVVLLDTGHAVVSWLQSNPAQLVARVVSHQGAVQALMPVESVGGQRNTGFPQMVEFNEQLLFAWTDASGDTPAIRTKIVALEV